MAEGEKKEASVEGLWEHGKWFLLAFIGLMLFFFVLQPVFLKDLIEPFWDFFGLMNAWGVVVTGLGSLWQEFGLFLVFVLVVFFWWIFSQKKQPEKK